MTRNVSKRTLGHARPTKIQINLRIRAVGLKSSFGAFWIAKDTKCIHAYNTDTDQADLNLFTGCAYQKVLFLWFGSNVLLHYGPFPTLVTCSVFASFELDMPI